jgi:hypothetical protein
MGFDSQDAKSIREAQVLLEKPSLAVDLTFIHSNLEFLAGSITKLEKAGLPLSHAVGIVQDAQKRLETLTGEKGTNLKGKMDSVLKKNSNLEVLNKVAKVLEGEAENLPEGMEPRDVAELKYAPIASVDAERSFSLFKHIFSDRRHNFTEENLSSAVISSFFYAQIQNE